ncbi:MAG: cyclic nucleotide-binding domain-containing protein, partial [Acidobacteria bacterium]|nr:cyclic nucleotide-binding domain-containing protein [Acidobacteriota bacterium]
RFEKTLERIFSLLGMLHPLKSVQTAFMVLRDSGVVSQANAVEYLDQILRGRTRAMVFPLIVPEMDLQTKLRHGEQAFPPLKEFGKNPWAELFRVPDVLLRVCLLSSLGSQMDSIPTEQISSSERVGHPMVRQAARQALSGKTPPEASAETEAAAAETATNRAPLTEVEKLKALQWTDVFSHADPDALVHLAQRAREQHFRKGELLFREKGPPDTVFCLVEGDVEFFREGKAAFHHVEPYQAFGYLSLLDRKPRFFSARAGTDSRVLSLTAEDFFEELADTSGFTQGFFQVLGSLLRKISPLSVR